MMAQLEEEVIDDAELAALDACLLDAENLQSQGEDVADEDEVMTEAELAALEAAEAAAIEEAEAEAAASTVTDAPEATPEEMSRPDLDAEPDEDEVMSSEMEEALLAAEQARCE